MKLEHKVLVDAPLAEVRAFLEDVPAVAKCIPAVEEAVAIEPDVYEGRARLKLGPLGFTIVGTAKLSRGEDGSWRLLGEGRDGKVGAGVKAALEAHLAELAPKQTEVQLNADVTFSGRLAELGQPLIRKKADSMVHEFAQNLRKQFAG